MIPYFSLAFFFFLIDGLWNQSGNRVSIVYMEFYKRSPGPSRMVNQHSLQALLVKTNLQSILEKL